jgi:hypothetical protein
MKIRMGFVANSSSSSFIVAFDRELSEITRDEFQRMLFGDKQYVCDPYHNYNWPTYPLASEIYYSLLKTDIESLRDKFDHWTSAARNFAANNKEKHLYFCARDDCTFFDAAIESGEYFENLNHVRISEH